MSLPEGITRSETGRLFCSRDGAEMVLIPDTEFWMGSETGGREESPVHRVRLSAFLVDRHEVTNRQFARFVDDTGYQTDAEKQGWGHSSQSGTWATQGATWRAPLGAGSNIQGRDAYPVTLVSWNDAQAYCRWAGKRLLTEAEFEMLLRGGLEGLDYPWGDTWPPPDGAGNFADECLREVQPEARGVIDGYRDGFWALSPVATFTQNSYGVFDISGNVAEWCGDWFAHEYYRVSPLENPRGPVEGGHRVCRGRGWGYSTDDNLRSSFRDALSPDYRADTVGFRCAKDL